MENTHHGRFKDAPWYSSGGEPINVLVGGAGGIGSWTSLLLARAGFIPIVYDFDSLEEHNLGGQLYNEKSIGMIKVDALQTIVRDFTGEEVVSMNEELNSDTPTHTYCIAAFDNMKARTIMYSKWKETYGNDPTAIFIDSRLTAEQMWIYCIRGGDYNTQLEYATDHLLTDDQIEETACTMKQTSHAAAMIASHIVGFFTNHITNVKEGEKMRAIPFYWEYFIPMNYLTSGSVLESTPPESIIPVPLPLDASEIEIMYTNGQYTEEQIINIDNYESDTELPDSFSF